MTASFTSAMTLLCAQWKSAFKASFPSLEVRRTFPYQGRNDGLTTTLRKKFLLGSRYCETDLLTDTAWRLFSNNVSGWSRVQAICDYIHNHIEFGYHHARNARTSWEVFQEREGVCHDDAHLAIALCRSMNIPARIGRILIARGRDAADVANSTAFGSSTLKCFKVHTDEIGNDGSRIEPRGSL